eukprot:gnl/MRDRNA2_/MRDRNA2_106051_c0_seq1.p2 gnl/MRDRNA2_/MRDRNA2_106051_c0~~gnl/MRDRNA2_/MRDRNA2_106051_c0_seq1.p2  ORF type:complete len:133 (+),score=20.28 gnl/MRDRNA2_/MRDRNA2_106051_c0_seq1:360-758(+)
MSYALELLVSAVLLTNITQFGYWRTVKRRANGKTHWERWGPVHLLTLATVMSLCQPMAVLLIYVGGVNYPRSKMWHSGSWWPNTPHGIFLLLLKYLGMAFLTVGVAQVTEVHKKMLKKWRELRDPDNTVSER